MGSINVYKDVKRAEAYAKLDFPGTYYLAYRDLPDIFFEHVQGKKALDFGCGTGRSTRFLQRHGFDTTGVDISEDMIKKAKEIDAKGKYYLIDDGDFSQFKENHYALVLAAFTFDNIPNVEHRINLLRKIKNLLNNEGRLVLINSTPEIYVNEWASFTTKDFPENKQAKSGDRVKIIMTDIEDQRPVEDLIWFNEDYQELFKMAGLELDKSYKPLAKEDEPFKWVNETKISPWVIYTLMRK